MENIVILGLDYEYNLKIGKILSDSLGMFFLDFKDYVEYSLFSTKDMLEKCGVEYLEKQQKKCLMSASEFENTVLCIPYNYFFEQDNNKLFESAQKFYIYFSKNKLSKIVDNDTLSVDLMVFSDRDFELNKACNHKIKVANKKIETVKCEILKILEGDK